MINYKTMSVVIMALAFFVGNLWAMDVAFLRVEEDKNFNVISINSLKNKKELSNNDQYNNTIVNMHQQVTNLINKQNTKIPYKGCSFSNSNFDQDLLDLTISRYQENDKFEKFEKIHFFKCHFTNKNMRFLPVTQFLQCTRGNDHEIVTGLKN